MLHATRSNPSREPRTSGSRPSKKTAGPIPATVFVWINPASRFWPCLRCYVTSKGTVCINSLFRGLLSLDPG